MYLHCQITRLSFPDQVASVEVNEVLCCVAGMPVCPDVSVQYGSLSYWKQTNGKNTAGTVTIVTCQTGYQPVGGHSVITCNSQGHWDPNPPACAG